MPYKALTRTRTFESFLLTTFSIKLYEYPENHEGTRVANLVQVRPLWGSVCYNFSPNALSEMNGLHEKPNDSCAKMCLRYVLQGQLSEDVL